PGRLGRGVRGGRGSRSLQRRRRAGLDSDQPAIVAETVGPAVDWTVRRRLRKYSPSRVGPAGQPLAGHAVNPRFAGPALRHSLRAFASAASRASPTRALTPWASPRA